MEGVDHVDVVEVSGCCLVGDVDRVVQRQVPDRERLPLRVAGANATLVVVVELGQAGCHLAGARAGGGDDDQVVGGLDVFICAVAFVRDDARNVVRVAGDREVAVNGNTEALKLLLHGLRFAIIVSPLSNNNRADVQSVVAEFVDVA